MSAIQRPGAIRDYFNVRATVKGATAELQRLHAESARLNTENAELKAENARLNELLAELHNRPGWSSIAGLLGFGFVCGGIVVGLVMAAVGVLT
jgi:hypothetical protein